MFCLESQCLILIVCCLASRGFTYFFFISYFFVFRRVLNLYQSVTDLLHMLVYLFIALIHLCVKETLPGTDFLC